MRGSKLDPAAKGATLPRYSVGGMMFGVFGNRDYNKERARRTGNMSDTRQIACDKLPA